MLFRTWTYEQTHCVETTFRGVIQIWVTGSVCPLLVTGRERPLRAPEGAASSDEGDSDGLTVVSVVFSSWHVEGINIDSSS